MPRPVNRNAAQILGRTKSNEFEEILSTLLIRRRLKDRNVLRDISKLAKELDREFNDFIELSLKTKVLFFAALWHCDKDEDLHKADGYISQLRALNPETDFRRIEAARLHCQGETEKAISILDPIRTPDSTAQMFTYLYLQKGPKIALEWISGADPFPFGQMAVWGWENAAIAMTEIGRWNDALDLLVRYQSENKEAINCIPFLEGMVRVGLTIGKEYRLAVIKGEIFPVKENMIEGPEVRVHRQKALECFKLVEMIAQQYKVKSGERGAQFWKSWLLLTDNSTKKQGIEFIQERLESSDPDLGVLDLAVHFGVDFNACSIQEDLRRKELIGALTPDDLFIKLTLLRQQKAIKEIVTFLKQEENRLIGSVMTSSPFIK